MNRVELIAAVTVVFGVIVVVWLAVGRSEPDEQLEASVAIEPTGPAVPTFEATRRSFEPELGSQVEDLPAIGEAELSLREERLRDEATLEERGLEARRALIERQTRRLEDAVERAESEGNQERARLLRQRRSHLSKMLAELDSGAPFEGDEGR